MTLKNKINEFVNVDNDVPPEIQKLADDDNAVIIAFIGSYIPRKINPVRSQLATIDLPEEFGLEETLKRICEKNTNAKKLYFLVNSLGGSISSSFKTAKLIRKLFDDITVFVPHIAASGGTLLALTGNKIIMGDMSQLGPVDPQIFYKDYGFRVSVNSIFRAKEKLDKVFETKKPDEVPYPERFMAESLDAVIVEEFFGLRQMTSEYIDHILKTVYDVEQQTKIKKWILTRLTNHSYVIDYELAKDIGMNVEHYKDYDVEKWELMRNWFSQYITEEENRHFIRYCIPNVK